MKAFVLILALALVSGSRAHEEDDQDVTLSTFVQDAMAELANLADNLQNQGLGPEVEHEVQELYKNVQKLGEKLRTAAAGASGRLVELAQELQTVVEQSAEDVWKRVGPYTRKLKKRLDKDRLEITKKADHYLSELQSYTSEQVDSAVARLEPYFAHVRDNAEAKINTLKRIVETGTEDLRGQIQENAAYIQQQMDGKMDELSTWFQPYVSTIRDTLQI